MRWASFAFALLGLLGSCGWRTGLDEGPLDGGTPVDGSPADAAPDTSPAPWELTCPVHEEEVPSREAVTLSIDLPEGLQGVRIRWRVAEAPDGSTARPAPRRSAPSVQFVPDRAGSYVVAVLVAVDGRGQQECEVHLTVVASDPEVSCPPDQEVAPLETVTLEGQVRADRPIAQYAWEVTDRPDGSADREPSPADARVTEFRPDVAGEYVLRFTVTDEAGATGSCQVQVAALSTQGLRVEIFWNGPPDRSCDTWTGPPPCDDTDVDVHLLRPGDETWFHAEGDCHWWNCTDGLRWGSPGPEDDPRLDLDVRDGFGPENINIDAPYEGTYRVGVDFWDGHSGTTADVTVNIYCGADPVAPDVTYGPVTLRDRSGGTSNPNPNDFWIVADVEVIAGAPCHITDLSHADGSPRIITHRQAHSTR